MNATKREWGALQQNAFAKVKMFLVHYMTQIHSCVAHHFDNATE